MLDFLIINGKYPDYFTKDFKEKNIGIENGKIVYIGDDQLDAKEIIDASGLIVSPGFIDIHMHEENFKTEGEKYVVSRMMLEMGVTTCVGGNCGVMHQTVEEFKNVIKKLDGSPTNYLMLTGYNEYRQKLGKGHYETLTKEEMEIIREKLVNDLNSGAIGISFGFEYDPAITKEEIEYAINASDNSDLMLAAHYRTSCFKNTDSVKEMIEIQNMTDKRFQISHLSSGCAYGKMDECLNLINEAMEKNPKLDYDTYPYDAFSTLIGSAVFDPTCFTRWNKSHDAVMLTDDPYKGVRCTPEIFEDAKKNYPEMLAVVFAMNEEEIAKAIANKNGMVASDAIINNGNGHPRAHGTFPRVLGKYVREDKVLSLIDALRKMTYEPARRLLLENKKGQIKVGYDADITIFNPDTIIDGATFLDLSIKPQGINYVFVDGKLSAKDSNIISEHNGRFIEFNELI